MLTWALYGVAVLFICALIVHVGLAAIVIWIARGEPDVNGDPERDAGFTHPPQRTNKPE